MRKDRLTDYLFIDEAMLRRYTDQISNRFIEEENHSWSMSASLTGPKLESSRNKQRRELNTYERIALLQTHLEDTDDLSTERPRSLKELRGTSFPPPRFIRETTDAIKVIVPTSHLTSVEGLSSFAVWISDPDKDLYSNVEWNWIGTFLYLTEVHWDNLEFDTVFSGCSALRMIVNAAIGSDLLDRSSSKVFNEFEPFGRGSYEHPIQKLERIGATISDRRKITTLYRKRYMTDEQCYTVNDNQRRVNDLLAYPIFIAATN
ncbi:MAG: hypothetical protein KME14_19675 [Tildeniella torsiva UHER 1998/13D]|jgi:hypothetical protein|nr:hypothetical protein [Tildeniella torsiva UHER 1998/13D]